MRDRKGKIIKIFMAVLLVVSMSIGICSGAAVTVIGIKTSTPTFRQIRLSWRPLLIEIPKEYPEEAPKEESEEQLKGDTEEVKPEEVAEDVTAATEAEPTEEASVYPEEELEEDSEAEPETDSEAEPTEVREEEASEETTAQPEEEQVSEKSAEMTDGAVEYEKITYVVYRATSKIGTYTKVGTTTRTYFTDTGLETDKNYYYKIRPQSESVQYEYSEIVSARTVKEYPAKLSLVMKGGKAFNVRTAAKQKLYGYDTVQGCCANNGMLYATLYNRKVEKCKIAKVRLSDMTVVKVSKPLRIYHGNSLTYNTKKGYIVAACCNVKTKRVVAISPKTLAVKWYKTIRLGSGVKNLPSGIRRGYAGINAIAYNEKHDCYYARLKKYGDYIKLNSSLKPIRYIKSESKKTWLLYQAVESNGYYIYDVQSFKGKRKYSMVTVRNRAGEYVGQIKFPYVKDPGYELQCIFHDGKQFYAVFYYSTSQQKDNENYHVTRTNYIYRIKNTCIQ